MTDRPQSAKQRLVLASTSPYRRELLARLIQDFDVIPPDIDESRLPGEPPIDLSARLARQKALAVAQTCPDAVVIGSDQVAALGTCVLGKPGTPENAVRQLLDCSGKTLEFFTSVYVVHLGGHFDESYTDLTRVSFRDLTRSETEAYVKADKPLDCAGSFKAEGLGVALFTSVETRDPTAILGLPLIWLAGSLARAGFQVLKG